ncbi:Tryptophan--tRNA ligase [Orchesella cincta]|uniref:tryptophan--tRNA ligase n=1 Tax=Orchesella cincta TaxID=48709 RepID=A0A1D2M859_ORCCI|nr:Tryptophan--tRNA ligase [Orchesella cincta]
MIPPIKNLVGTGLGFVSLRHGIRQQSLCHCRQMSSSSVRKYSSGGSKKGEEEVNQIYEESKHEIQGRPRVFSGIQPTGDIHLGNYFGAIRQWVKFQEEKKAGKYEHCIYSVVDLHAITMPQDRHVLEKNIFQAVATLLACGIDPNESILFLQSHVPLHPQLAWVLGCLSTMPQLGRLPNFRDKSKRLKEVPLDCILILFFKLLLVFP